MKKLFNTYSFDYLTDRWQISHFTNASWWTTEEKKKRRKKKLDIKCDIYSYLRFLMGKAEKDKERIWKVSSNGKEREKKTGPIKVDWSTNVPSFHPRYDLCCFMAYYLQQSFNRRAHRDIEHCHGCIHYSVWRDNQTNCNKESLNGRKGN